MRRHQHDFSEPGRGRGSTLGRGLETHRSIGDTGHMCLAFENGADFSFSKRHMFILVRYRLAARCASRGCCSRPALSPWAIRSPVSFSWVAASSTQLVSVPSDIWQSHRSESNSQVRASGTTCYWCRETAKARTVEPSCTGAWTPAGKSALVNC
jgi:hypothetical protein